MDKTYGSLQQVRSKNVYITTLWLHNETLREHVSTALP
jgi:hypothetical protein